MRKEGFRKALAEYNGCEVRYYESGFRMNAAVEAANHLLEDWTPTIVVCGTDNIALGVMRAAF